MVDVRTGCGTGVVMKISGEKRRMNRQVKQKFGSMTLAKNTAMQTLNFTRQQVDVPNFNMDTLYAMAELIRKKKVNNFHMAYELVKGKNGDELLKVVDYRSTDGYGEHGSFCNSTLPEMANSIKFLDGIEEIDIDVFGIFGGFEKPQIGEMEMVTFSTNASSQFEDLRNIKKEPVAEQSEQQTSSLEGISHQESGGQPNLTRDLSSDESAQPTMLTNNFISSMASGTRFRKEDHNKNGMGLFKENPPRKREDRTPNTMNPEMTAFHLDRGKATAQKEIKKESPKSSRARRRSPRR